MSISEIKEIIQLFSEADISLLKLKSDNFTLHLQKPSQPDCVNVSHQAYTRDHSSYTPQVPALSSPSDTSSDYITSPMVGTFYCAPSPGAAPYVKVGDVVKKGQVVGIVEAMKIMNEIEADFDCMVLSMEVGDGQPVEFGSKLVAVSKSDQ